MPTELHDAQGRAEPADRTLGSALRRVGWLFVGVLAGVAVGFLVGLGRPRPRLSVSPTPTAR